MTLFPAFSAKVKAVSPWIFLAKIFAPLSINIWAISAVPPDNASKRGEYPSRSCILMIAHFWIITQQLPCNPMRACRRQLKEASALPSLSMAFTSAPAFRRMCAIMVYPFHRAIRIGGVPFSSSMWILKPARTKRSIICWGEGFQMPIERNKGPSHLRFLPSNIRRLALPVYSIEVGSQECLPCTLKGPHLFRCLDQFLDVGSR